MSEKVVNIGTEKALMEQAWEETVATLQKGYDQLKEKYDRMAEEVGDLRVALDSEKQQHDETRGYRQKAEQELEAARKQNTVLGTTLVGAVAAVQDLTADGAREAELAYLRFFHFAVTGGIICGLDHPIEWAINAYRTPGFTPSPDHYRDARKHLPQFLCEMFRNLNMREPESADEVLTWCDEHYPEGHLARRYFEFLKPEITGYLERRS
jgi:hypothetical protein